MLHKYKYKPLLQSKVSRPNQELKKLDWMCEEWVLPLVICALYRERDWIKLVWQGEPLYYTIMNPERWGFLILWTCCVCSRLPPDCASDRNSGRQTAAKILSAHTFRLTLLKIKKLLKRLPEFPCSLQQVCQLQVVTRSPSHRYKLDSLPTL